MQQTSADGAKFHIFYDTRLKVKPNSNGNVIKAGSAFANFSAGSAMAEKGQRSVNLFCCKSHYFYKQLYKYAVL